MRPLSLALLVAAAAAVPLRASADLRLASRVLDGSDRPAPGTSGPSARLEVPSLHVDGDASGPEALAGGGAGGKAHADPVVALILGFFPGLGLGHLVAGSPNWVIWLVVDLVLYVVVFGFFDEPFGVLGAVVWLAVHVFQAIDAYRAAGGKSLGALSPSGGLVARAAPAQPSPSLQAVAAGRELLPPRGLALLRF
jgi:hypothetical protein